MDFVGLTRLPDGTFEEKVSSFQMRVLYNFLETTVAIFAKDVKKELMSSGVYLGNSDFAKKKNNYIVIGNSFNDSWTIALPEEQFFSLIEKWDKLLKMPMLPEKATISMDDDYNFEIKYEMDLSLIHI